MTAPFIIDAHAHFGSPGQFFVPEYSSDDLLLMMDRLGIRYSICAGDQISIFDDAISGIGNLHSAYKASQGRLLFMYVYDPRDCNKCLGLLNESIARPGFAGIKIHPSLHGVGAEDKRYEPIWKFAADHDVPILAHTWSISDYNPVQRLSTPERFEPFIRAFPQVKLVLGHAGGRGTGRYEAIRMANEYASVYVDFAGDIFCHNLIESLVSLVPVEKILFGSDFPWIDPRANLSRVFLSDTDNDDKKKILGANAALVYKIGKNQ